MCLPAVIAGRDFWDIMLIYFRQTGTYDDLVLNFPNLYNFLQTDIDFFIKYSELVSKIGILVTLSIFACIWLYTLIKKVKFTSEKIITVALWSIVICNFFLPHMHDRYFFLAETFFILYACTKLDRIHLPIMQQVSGLIAYSCYGIIVPNWFTEDDNSEKIALCIGTMLNMTAMGFLIYDLAKLETEPKIEKIEEKPAE